MYSAIIVFYFPQTYEERGPANDYVGSGIEEGAVDGRKGVGSKSGECCGHWTESKRFRRGYKAREKSLRCIH